jgi:uncharacterized membrane protein YidH (DUF202 family)
VKAKYLVALAIVVIVYTAVIFYATWRSLEELRRNPLDVSCVFTYTAVIVTATMMVLIIIELIIALSNAEESLNRY